MGLSKKLVLRVGSSTFVGAQILPQMEMLIGDRFRISVAHSTRWPRIVRDLSAIPGRYKKAIFLLERFREYFPDRAKEVKLAEFKHRRGSRKATAYKSILQTVGRRSAREYDAPHR